MFLMFLMLLLLGFVLLLFGADIVSVLVNMLKDDSTEPALFVPLVRVLGNLVGHSLEEEELRALANFVTFTLTPKSPHTPALRPALVRRYTRLRNMVLHLLLDFALVAPQTKATPRLAKVLDPQWAFTILQPATNPLTVIITLKIAAELLRNDKKWATKFKSLEGYAKGNKSLLFSSVLFCLLIL